MLMGFLCVQLLLHCLVDLCAVVLGQWGYFSGRQLGQITLLGTTTHPSTPLHLPPTNPLCAQLEIFQSWPLKDQQIQLHTYVAVGYTVSMEDFTGLNFHCFKGILSQCIGQEQYGYYGYSDNYYNNYRSTRLVQRNFRISLENCENHKN